MRAVVVYESMFGATHEIADAIGEALRDAFDVTVVSAADVTASEVAAADLVVAGAPTHAHSMPRASTKRMAVDMAKKDGSGIALDPSAGGRAMRGWLEDMAPAAGVSLAAAAFDTRLTHAGWMTGRASRGIARRLRHHGFRLVVPPESFFVGTDNRLLPGEVSRAAAWAGAVARRMGAASRGVAARF
jgi:hypothetical protein